MTPAPFDPTFAIDIMLPAAQAAYLAMSVPMPTLSLPAGYSVAGVLQADPDLAAPLMAVSDPDQKRLAVKMVTESSIFGVVLWSGRAKTAIVAIRGTATLTDWLSDIECLPVPNGPDPGTGLVHLGVLLVYEHIRGSAIRLVQACPGLQRILVTGHSLGGGLAALCALDLARDGGFTMTPELLTFAAMRAGDPQFAAFVNLAIPINHRVVNWFDCVPQLPFAPLYQHAGQEITVHGGWRPLDITYAHHLGTYERGLRKLLPAASIAA
jgi:hypothetical protein